jgi:hypothetical protein
MPSTSPQRDVPGRVPHHYWAAVALASIVCRGSAAHAAPAPFPNQEPQAEGALSDGSHTIANGGNGANGDRAVLDRVTVRFYAPETGGAARPRFVTDRTLSFEARLIAMSEQGASVEAPPQERQLHLALDRHVAEELLSSLGIEGRRGSFDLTPLADEARAELERRIGGKGPLQRAATIEQIDPEEVEALFLRHARATYYLDRHVAPLLSPGEEQLRDVFRSSAHPFRDSKFDEVRKDFTRWFVAERVKSAEATFLQTARARVKIVIIGH